ncbi:MAG: hypothetical protein ACKVW3_05155 [Phycisphaerales bacterium]
MTTLLSADTPHAENPPTPMMPGCAEDSPHQLVTQHAASIAWQY